jgi:hypothetical protein
VIRRVSLSEPGQNALIDAAILSVTSARWLKVARIIAHSEKLLAGKVLGINANPQNEEEVAESEKGLLAIERRIQALVDDGRLEGAGNLSNWRHSEVRLPPHAE